MTRSRTVACLTLILPWLLGSGLPSLSAETPPPRQHDFARWESAIAAFESADQSSPPTPGGIVFVGSSTMRLWKTAELLPDLPIVNRGFGGSELIDSAHFAPRIVVPCHPKVVLLYAGSNDLSKGAAPCQVAADFEQFVTVIHAACPQAEIVFLSIKPSTKRWPIIHRIRATNSLIEATCVDHERVHFLNVHPEMLNAAGEPETAWLSADGLHLNADGYRRLTELVRPTLERLLHATGEPTDPAPAPKPAAPPKPAAATSPAPASANPC